MRQVIHAFRTDFEASDEDTSDATYQYFGFLAHSGKWIIQRFDLSTPDVILYRYAFGTTDYATAWGNRAVVAPNPGFLTYDYYNTIKFI